MHVSNVVKDFCLVKELKAMTSMTQTHLRKIDASMFMGYLGDDLSVF